MLHRKIILAIAYFLITLYSFGQMTSDPQHQLYKIDQKLKSGDKNAFYEIAPYFDSKKELIERYAWNHISAITEADVAKRIIDVNSVFTKDELSMYDSISSQIFLNFLDANSDKITYSEYAGAFFITPLESRNTKILFREMTDKKRIAIKKEKKTILKILDNKEITSLLNQENSKVLLIISSELYKGRNWLNSLSRYNDNTKVIEYLTLLQILTNFEIAVEDYSGKMTWHIGEEFHHTAALNLLCYFSANYKKFEWNKEKKIFENNEIHIRFIAKEVALFQLLSSKNDSKALNAFTKLTTSNPERVRELAEEYENANIDKNYALPTFPYRFLKQLVLLVDYCNANDIDFKGSSQLKSVIKRLQSKLSFKERRKLEDNIINNLTLEQITAFEYWALINQKSWGLTYSAGRILDVFYSKNWEKLLNDEKHLNCYLKKSALFNRLGIIGVCNKYLVKFSNSSQNILTHLETIQTSDEDIKRQIEKIITMNKSKIYQDNSETISWKGNDNNEVKNLEEQLVKLTKSRVKSEKTDNDISKLLSQISYEQIPTALNLIENFPFQNQRKKYSFMHRDWGFFMYSQFDKKNNFDKKSVRKEFLKLYSNLSEYELYSYYLKKAGIDYITDNNLDFDKIYELIKYNIVVAFVGGGGGIQDNEVYSLIKLLELTFNTTLGFPKKLCNSNNMYSCSSDNRAKAWMNYLTENNLLKKQHNEPVSFSFQ